MTPERFMSRLDRRGECWIWTGSRCGRGMYGGVWHRGRYMLAHRYAYEVWVGPIPEGMVILHLCDVPLCVRPTHLRAGTQQDNMRDCSEKGRTHIPAGERHPLARLTEDQVREIRETYNPSRRKRAAFAADYGVAAATIDDIVRRRTWKHVA